MKTLFAVSLAALLLSGCIVLPLGGHGHHYAEPRGAVVVPPPVVVRPYGPNYRRHDRHYWGDR